MTSQGLPHTNDGAGTSPISSRPRRIMSEEVAEALGAFTIILFGAGSQCQVQLYPSAGGYIVNVLGWAVGVSLGAYIAGGISGGHINPAVTIAMAVFRGFPWSKVPRYIIAQTIGCMLAALLVHLNYSQAISALAHHQEGSSSSSSSSSGGLFLAKTAWSAVGKNSAAGNFISIPHSSVSSFTAWFDEFLGTATLVGFIFVFTDSNLNPGSNLPFALFLLVAGIAVSLGAQTGFAINPARDLGPRIALSFLGYGSELWSHNSAYWLWGIWLSTIPGGLVGAFVADSLLYTGTDSLFSPRSIEQVTL